MQEHVQKVKVSMDSFFLCINDYMKKQWQA